MLHCAQQISRGIGGREHGDALHSRGKNGRAGKGKYGTGRTWRNAQR
jgi:hypothetical protein